jgi:hypothetical protein
MSAPRYNTRYQEKLANAAKAKKAAAVCPPAPIKVSKKAQSEELLRACLKQRRQRIDDVEPTENDVTDWIPRQLW